MEPFDNKKSGISSLVNEYQVSLLDAGYGKTEKKSVTEEKMEICFKSLDGIIPKLGMFQKVVKAIRDDIYDGVYSFEYTSNKENGVSQMVQRKPYFLLLNRINEKRDEKADELLSNIEKLEESCEELNLVIKGKDLEISKHINAVEELQAKISSLQSEVIDKIETITRLNSSISNLENDIENAEKSHQKRVEDLKIELSAAAEESKRLQVYKDGHDKLKDSFENPHLSLKEYEAVNMESNQERVENFRIGQIKKDLSVMDTLEQQLYVVRNSALQEYDDFMESNKRQYEMAETSSFLLREIKTVKDDSEIERESQELVRRQSVFANTMLDIKEELKLLFQHKEVLEAELSRLEKDEVNRKEARKHKDGGSKSTLEELDLVEVMAGNTDDPFVPHQNILNKYSSMIYTSCNEGKTFYEMTETSFCDSCGVKTLVCPHSVTERERVFTLPRNCTHIKIVRPEVKGSKKRRRKKSQAGHSINENTLLPRLRLIWDDYFSRQPVERKIQRSLSEEYLLSVINQFYALMIWQDEYQPTEEEPQSFLNSLFDFLRDRFILDDIILLAFYDFLMAVEKFAKTNKQIHLFAACLDGTIDAAVFRYVLLMAEFINSFHWNQMQDFTSFVSIIYPFLQEDDLEQLRMGYTSFSENKVSPLLVFQYLLYIILNGREPRFIEFEIKLLQCPIRRPGYFSDIEFTEALDSLVPLASEKLLHRLYSQAVKHFPDANETIHVSRISHITSYLSLIHNTPRIKNSIKQWKLENPKSVLTKQGAHQKLPDLVTLSKIKAMGMEMGRRARARKAQEAQQRLAVDFNDTEMPHDWLSSSSSSSPSLESCQKLVNQCETSRLYREETQ